MSVFEICDFSSKFLFDKIQKENVEEINTVEVILNKSSIQSYNLKEFKRIKESQNTKIVKLTCYLLEPALH